MYEHQHMEDFMEKTNLRFPLTEKDFAFTISEFCERSKISRALYYKRPELFPTAIKVAGKRLITKLAVDAWLKGLESTSTGAER